ncbi:MAG: guanylate kinase [Hyphomicrobiales bacterium]|nr:guanylate kinase [Hyphomicrobiales bacterium]
MLILSSPSGTGKTTLSRMLLQDRSLHLTLSVSVTTRARRPSEADGVHYHFIDKARFDAMAAAGDLLEWAQVHDNFYGTPRSLVEKELSLGHDVLFDIDYQGTQQVKRRAGKDVVTIFLLPPSMSELKARLQRRAEDSPAVIATRLANARQEMQRWRDYDYVLVNEDIDATFRQLQAIIAAERLRIARSAAAVELKVAALLAEVSA